MYKSSPESLNIWTNYSQDGKQIFKTILNYCVIVYQIYSGIPEVKCDILIENKRISIEQYIFSVSHISALFMPKNIFYSPNITLRVIMMYTHKKTDLQIKWFELIFKNLTPKNRLWFPKFKPQGVIMTLASQQVNL